MAEDQVLDQPQTEPKTTNTVAANPFADDNWGAAPKPVMETVNINEPKEDAPVVELPKPEQAATAEPIENDEIFNEEDYIKNTLGFNSADEIKAAKAELEQLRQKANEPQFTGESERLLKAIKENKLEDIYDVLDKQIKLDRISKLDPKNPNNAAQIVKADLQYKYPNLDQSDIDFEFEQKYSVPEKPNEDTFADADDYKVALAKWEKQVSVVNKRLEVDAKLAQPELAKFKSDISLPEIKQAEPTVQQPTQEELQALEVARQQYLSSLESGLKTFSGYNVVIKDEDVELPISYGITDQEKGSLKNELSNFDHNEYFQKRWLDKDGKFNTEQIAKDIYLLDNTSKVFQKLVNEAVAQKEANRIKKTRNITVGGGATTTVQQPVKNSRQLEVEHIWKNG